MLNYPINYNLIGGEMQKHYELNHEHPTSTMALASCMMATGFYRIYNQEDMEEFLFRLPIILEEVKVLDNWFNEGYLFTYVYKGQSIKFGIEDLKKNLGIRIADRIRPCNSREELYHEVDLYRQRIRISGFFNDIEILPVDFEQSDEIFIEDLTIKKYFHPKHKSLFAAKLLASEVVEIIGDDTFKNRNEELVREDLKFEQMRFGRMKNLGVNNQNPNNDRSLKETDPFISFEGISRIAILRKPSKN